MRRSLTRVLGVMLIWAGVNQLAGLVFRRTRRRHAGSRRHFLVTHGGSETRPGGDDVRDAVVSVMMGGLVLDLRDAELSERPARLDILVVMGGLELKVPENWRVRVDMDVRMGGVRDDRGTRIDPDRPVDLELSGHVTFGGVEITSDP